MAAWRAVTRAVAASQHCCGDIACHVGVCVLLLLVVRGDHGAVPLNLHGRPYCWLLFFGVGGLPATINSSSSSSNGQPR